MSLASPWKILYVQDWFFCMISMEPFISSSDFTNIKYGDFAAATKVGPSKNRGCGDCADCWKVSFCCEPGLLMWSMK